MHPYATDWLAKGICLDFQQEQEICHFSTTSSQSSSGVHTAAYAVGTGGALPRGRVAGA